MDGTGPARGRYCSGRGPVTGVRTSAPREADWSFRPDVQGLRAIAVVMVVVYHLHPSAVPGGFVGVDVFFVISGFLITGHLARNYRRDGRVRVLAFWGRRARRLLPAAALVLTLTWVASRVLLPATRLPAAAEQIRASALYFQNWVLAHNAVDYLTAADAPSPVQHFWSLSVEEQFYLCWPVLFVVAALVARGGRRRAGWVVLVVLASAVAAGSFAYSAYLIRVDPAAAYFVTTTRVWELVVGGLLAFAPASVQAQLGRQGWLAWVGLAMVATSGFLLDGSAPFPGTVAVVPVGGAALMLACGGRRARRGTWWLTTNRPLVFLGNVSYSLYLWHWPLIVLWSARTGHRIGYRDGFAIAAAAVLLAWLTKILVEDPVRRAPVIALRPGRSLATALTLAIPVGVVVLYAPPRLGPTKLDLAHQGAAVVAPPVRRSLAPRLPPKSTPTLPSAIPASAVPPIALAPQDFAPYSQCETPPAELAPRPCFYGDQRHPRLRVVLVGDSVANQYRSILANMARTRHWLVISDLHSQCPWTATMTTLQHSGAPYSVCHDWGAQVLHDIMTRYHPDVLVTSDRPVLGTAAHPASDAVSFGQIADGMVSYWSQLAAHGTKIIAIRESPEPGRNIPDCLSRPRATIRSCTTSTRKAIVQHSPLQQAVAKMRADAELLDVNSAICYPSLCPPIIGNVVVYRDTHHLTQTYIRSLEPYFVLKLLATRAVHGR